MKKKQPWDWKRFRGGEECIHWVRKDLDNLEVALSVTPGRTAVVQAGGNIGIFPKRLAEEFDTVYTFEPDPVMFKNMVLNAPETNIVRMQAALGKDHAPIKVLRAPDRNEGTTYVEKGGVIPCLMIDDLELDVCDLIYLDIEGAEQDALRGAVKTIQRCRPVIVCELNKNGKKFGYTDEGTREFIKSQGYLFYSKQRADEIFIPEERMPTVEMYQAAFEKECQNVYPEIDAFEREYSVTIGKERLHDMASVLACPVKVNPPNWQHGRVLYSLAWGYLISGGHPLLIDIGTAKGFSAVMLAMALKDSEVENGSVVTVDIVDPDARVIRNTIVELEGLKTVHETCGVFIPEGVDVQFHGGGSLALLQSYPADTRIGFAFIDGKHNAKAVWADASQIMARQIRGDIMVFDDIQILGVAEAVGWVEKCGTYTMRYLQAKPERRYAIATRM